MIWGDWVYSRGLSGSVQLGGGDAGQEASRLDPIGYIEKRYVDIGDRVKAGALLADITAPELDHQIAQAKATLAQTQATLQQTQASRELAEVTNTRDSRLVKQGWLTLQQGDNDRLTLQAQQAAGGVAQSNIAAQEAQIRILEQEKAYQR